MTRTINIQLIYFKEEIFFFMQGTIISKTAMENYKEFGPALFEMSVAISPAKRLGVPEEVNFENH